MDAGCQYTTCHEHGSAQNNSDASEYHIGRTVHHYHVIGSDVRLHDYGDHSATNGCLFIFIMTSTSLCGQIGPSVAIGGDPNCVVGIQ